MGRAGGEGEREAGKKDGGWGERERESRQKRGGKVFNQPLQGDFGTLSPMAMQ